MVIKFNRLPDEVNGIHTGAVIDGVLTDGVQFQGVMIGLEVFGVEAIWHGPNHEVRLVTLTRSRQESDVVGKQFEVGDYSYALERSVILERPTPKKSFTSGD